jgi:CheY-like chemotaxis protein
MAHVVVVDDDRDIRETLRLVLEDADYTVSEAADGVKALQTLHTLPGAAVVLLDLMMPGLDGAGVIRAIHGDAALSGRCQCILMTAAHTTFPLPFVTILTAMRVPVLHKPLDLDMLLAQIAKAARQLP